MEGLALGGWGHGYSVALLCFFGYTKQVLSILSQVTSGFTEPRLPYGGEHADLSYCYKWQILNEESRARVYLVHEISNCVPGSLGILAAEPP